MIINGTGTVQSALECEFDDDNRSYYTEDFRSAHTDLVSRTGLPDNGQIISTGTTYTGAAYQLEGYNEKNVLFLFNEVAYTKTYPKNSGIFGGANTSGTLTLVSSGSYEKLLFLASSANGESRFTATVNFSDGSSMNNDFYVYDWCNTGAQPSLVAIGDDAHPLGRIRPSDNATEANPRLYDCYIDLSAHKDKLVSLFNSILIVRIIKEQLYLLFLENVRGNQKRLLQQHPPMLKKPFLLQIGEM